MNTKRANDGIVTDLGGRRYRIERGWARLPDGMSFGMVSHLAASADGRVFVLQRKDPPVLVFAPARRPARGRDRRACGHAG